jgi:hypothetical protein
MRVRPLVLLGTACALGLAAWVSQGVVAVTDTGAGGGRVGELPALWWLAVWTAIAGAFLAATYRRRIPWLPFLVPLVVVLPWLPLPVPAAALIWTGPLVIWVWIGTGVAAIAAAWRQAAGSSFGAGLVRDPRRAPWLALVVAFVTYCGAAQSVRVSLLNGDEPHYLVITQSLLEDHDLQVENNYRNGRYHDYFSGDLRPDFLRRGQNEQIYSIHAPGLSALVLPAFAAAGYRGVVVLLALLASIGASLLWRAGYRLTGSPAAAWFGWATVACGAPTFFHAVTIYPDGAGAVVVMLGVSALVAMETPAIAAGRRTTVDGPVRATAPWGAWRWGLLGAALGVLPWLHTRLAGVAALLAGFLALRLLARRAFGRAAALLAVLAVSVAVWLGFFYAIYGELNPSAPYAGIPQATWSNIPRALPALLFDQQFGLVPNAPAYGLALAGIVPLLRARRRLAVELSLLLVAYILLVAGFHMWWGGRSAPARLLVPVLPVLGLPAAVSWSRWRSTGRAIGGVALTLTVLITAAMVATERGALIFNERDGVGQLLEWATPVVDLPRALPSYLRDAPAEALRATGVWLAAMLAAMAGVRLLAWRAGRRGGDVRGALALGAPLAFCAGVMAAASVGWTAARASGFTPTTAELAFLRAYDPDALPLGVRFPALARAPVAEIAGRFLLQPSRRRPVAPDDPLLFLIDVPPGVYRVSSATALAPTGTVDARIGRGREPVDRWEFEPGSHDADRMLCLPVSVNAVILTGDPRARSSMPNLALQPVSIVARGRRPATPRAAQAARYGDLVVYSFTPEVYLEVPGLWVVGGLPVPLALTVDPPAAKARVLLRNGPVPNRVTLRGPGTSVDLALQPGEERVVEVPVDRVTGGAALEITAERGFRPADFDKTTKDVRYLGVWIQAGGQG